MVIMKFCYQDISKTFTAMSFKLGQLIEDNELITKRKLKKKFDLLSLAYLDIENLIS